MKRVLGAMSCGLLMALIVACFTPHPTVALECHSRNKSHNSYFGRRSPRDHLLYRTHVLLDSRWYRTVSTDVYFPARASLKGNITYIELHDQKSDGSGGCGYIRSGGPGYNFTSIHLKSSGWNGGIDFVVLIYGRPSIWR